MELIKENPPMDWTTILAGQIRHVLTGIAGGLVTVGALQADQQGAFIQIGSGLVIYAIGAAWSWWQKQGHAAALAAEKSAADYWRSKKTTPTQGAHP